MKALHVIIFVAVLIVLGGIFFGSSNQKVEAPTPVAPEIPVTETPKTETSTSSTQNPNEHGMTPEEHAVMMGEATAGNDVGMEMPIMDSELQAGAVTGEKKSFMVHGANFSFDPKEIRVTEGDEVTIHFMSVDGLHDWVIDEFNARSEKIKTGGMSKVTFIASKKGTYEYYCSIGSHRANGMVGKLIVE